MSSKWINCDTERGDDVVQRNLLNVAIQKDIWESFEELEHLGDGTYGTVSKARSGSRLVAVKLFKRTYEPYNLIGAATEVFVSHKASHPSIVKLEGVYLSPLDHSIRMSMEYMDAGCLRNLIDHARFDMGQVGYVLSRVLSGLKHLHDYGVIHRDIKPGNVLVNRAGGIKIADFGLATWISNTGYASDASEIGTPYYMAPEYGFRAGYGAPVDVWAVGVMALEMTTGKIPYGECTAERALRRMMIEGPPIPDMPRLLRQIIERMLRVNARERGDAGSIFTAFPVIDLLAKSAERSMLRLIEASVQARV